MLRGLKVFDFIKMQHRVLSINLSSRFVFRISTSHPGNLSGRLVLTQPHFLMISINGVIFSFWTVKFRVIEGKQNVLDSECGGFVDLSSLFLRFRFLRFTKPAVSSIRSQQWEEPRFSAQNLCLFCYTFILPILYWALAPILFETSLYFSAFTSDVTF